MVSGLFQSKREFDRTEGQFRRTYLYITEVGDLYLSNLPESSNTNDIKNSPSCWQSSTPFMLSICKLQLFRIGSPNITLEIKLTNDCLIVTDPEQDGWGGFGGVYERV